MTIYFLLLGRTSVTCVWENVSSVISVVLVRDSVPTKQSEYQDLEALFPTYSISFLYLLLIIIPEVFVREIGCRVLRVYAMAYTGIYWGFC